MWLQKNKWKIIVPVLVLAMLAATFCFGGNAPGSDGSETVSTAPDARPDITLPPAPEEREPEETIAPPAPEQTEAPVQTVPEPTPEQTVEVDPETGKDEYLTEPVPEGKPLPVEPQDGTIGTTAYTCTISISCAAILDNIELCDPAKAELVPADGWILRPVTVTFYEGESVFNILQRVCKQNQIHMEFENTPIYNSAYIEGIHNLYEFDVGALSGWMYKVNDWFPNYGCSRYAVKNGDIIDWVYTCDLGLSAGSLLPGNGRRE